MRALRIAVLGAGYVGAVAAAGFAELGHRVLCVDRDPRRIAMWRASQAPLHEPGLSELVRKGTSTGRLRFALTAADMLSTCDAVVVAVGTPLLGAGSVDLAQFHAAVDDVVSCMRAGATLVVKSTVPPGTCAHLSRRLHALRPGEILVASNPEFLRQGSAVQDFFEPSRTVVGVDDQRAERCLRALYRGIEAPFVVTDFASAELIKYAANAYLATKISFINEIARLCDALGADIGEVSLGIGLDPRIGTDAMQAGLGFGGSCLPKDLCGLLALGRTANVPLPLASAVHEVNDAQIVYVAQRISDALGGLQGRRIAVLGGTFKVGTDDVRGSPALALIRRLASDGAVVCACDPIAGEKLAAEIGDVAACLPSADAAAAGADAVVLATPWPQFQAALGEIKERMRGDVFCDARNAVDPRTVRSAGLRYLGVGRSVDSMAGQAARLAG